MISICIFFFFTFEICYSDSNMMNNYYYYLKITTCYDYIDSTCYDFIYTSTPRKLFAINLEDFYQYQRDVQQIKY